MRVLVHDRTDGLPSRLVGHAEERLERLSRHFDKIAEVTLEFQEVTRREGSPGCSVQITVRTGGHRHALAYVEETALDARSALDIALDKIDRQVVKMKEKIKIERKRASMQASPGDEPEAAPAAELERIRLKLWPQTVADAEAALEESDQPCYVFLDEASGQINVCYRRADGGLTVIEPVVT